MTSPYLPRSVDGLLDELLLELPALLLVGPRATGKTTAAERRAKTIVKLDNDQVASAFKADSDAALRGLPEPVLIDEFRQAPRMVAGPPGRPVRCRRGVPHRQLGLSTG